MSNPDDLERLLGPRASASSPELRNQLREQTSRRVARRSRARRTAAAAALAACYAAGCATVWLAQPAAPAPASAAGNAPAMNAAPAPASPELPLSPRQLELAAEQADGAESARLFVEAGRRYGRDWNDWQSALRCYRNYLDLTPDTPAIEPNSDDWLLAKLKTDRRVTHANP
jgi:hypothetical protein